LCLALLRPDLSSVAHNTPTAWWILALLGVLLPSVFLIMAGAVHQAGIVLSDAAQRLSLVIPLLAAFLLFGEAPSSAKLAGIAVALLALVCLLARPRAATAGCGAHAGAIGMALLLGVWLGYGAIDILFKQLAKS